MAHEADQRQVVTGDHDCHALGVQLPEQSKQIPGQIGIQVTGGFISQQNGRHADDGAGDSHTLLLSPGQGHRPGFFLAQQTNLVQSGTHPFANIRIADAGNHEWQGYVVEHRLVVEQFVVLENHPDTPAHPGRQAGRRFAQIPAINEHLAAGCFFQHQGESQQSAFPCT